MENGRAVFTFLPPALDGVRCDSHALSPDWRATIEGEKRHSFRTLSATWPLGVSLVGSSECTSLL